MEGRYSTLLPSSIRSRQLQQGNIHTNTRRVLDGFLVAHTAVDKPLFRYFFILNVPSFHSKKYIQRYTSVAQ